MILNNFLTMQRIRELWKQPLSPQLVPDLHRLVTEGTLDDPADAGRLRPPGKEVVVDDLCRFANGETPKVFIHPVVRAIALHFWLAYDHPFCDGNGRTARGQYERSFLLSESDDNDLTDVLLAQVNVILQAIGSLHTYLERKAGEVGPPLLRHGLRHAGYRYTVLSHQNSHVISHQTARSDLTRDLPLFAWALWQYHELNPAISMLQWHRIEIDHEATACCLQERLHRVFSPGYVTTSKNLIQ